MNDAREERYGVDLQYMDSHQQDLLLAYGWDVCEGKSEPQWPLDNGITLHGFQSFVAWLQSGSKTPLQVLIVRVIGS